MNIKFNQIYIALSLFGLLTCSSCATTKGYTGTVQEIERGKDGYTAKLEDDKGIAFDAIFSIPRLQKNYMQLKAGDKVKLSGDTIHLNNRTRVLVTGINTQP